MTASAAYFQNGIGNFIALTPALRAFADMDTSGKIDMIFYSGWHDSRTKSVRELAEHLPFVETVREYPRKRLPMNYSNWFYNAHSEVTALTRVFRSRTAFKSYRFNTWKTMHLHEIDYYMDHVYRMGYDGPIPAQCCPVADKPVLSGKRPYIGLCNGGFGKLRNQKTWPYFPALATMLKALNGTIIKFGFSRELNDVTAFDVNYVGRLPILETAKAISQLDLLITTDTGNMHIADALNVKMIALFGGSSVVKNGPINGTAKIMKSDIICQPCQGKQSFYSCDHHYCMMQLTADKVFQQVRRMV